MRLRDRIGRMLRAGGGALNGMLYDRLSAIEEKLDRLEGQNRELASVQQSIQAGMIRPDPAPPLERPPGREEFEIFAKFAKAGYDPAVIYDIGAANGGWSADMHEIFPRACYHLFEPLARALPEYASSLAGHLAANPNFILHPFALGAQHGEVQMTLRADGYGSSIHDMRGQPEFTGQCAVTQWPLDEYVARHDVPLPDLIKIDTQAYELVILAHASHCLEHASIILAETWLDRDYGPRTPLIHELNDLLSAHGFQLVEMGHRFYDRLHRLFSFDAVYLKRSEVVRFCYGAMPPGPW